MSNLANKHKKKIRKTNKQYPLMEYFLEDKPIENATGKFRNSKIKKNANKIANIN